jgi:DNA-binding transcriptional LysR family regulator
MDCLYGRNMKTLEIARDIINENVIEKAEANDLIDFYELISLFGFKSIIHIYPKEKIISRITLLDNLGIMNKSEYESQGYISPENFYSININWLKYFVIVSDFGNITLAAEHLDIAPQTINHSIHGIEQHLKLNLFKVKSNNRILTPAGKMLYIHAKVILNNFHSIHRFFSDIKIKNHGYTLKIAYSYIKEPSYLPIINIMKKYPKTYIKTNFVGNFMRKQLMVANGELDLAFIIEKDICSFLEDIEFVKLMDLNYVIVGKPQTKKNWDAHKYITTKYTYKPRNIWDEDKFPRDVIAESNNMSFLLNLCEAGVGAAYLPYFYVKDKIKEGKLAIVADPPFVSNYSYNLIWNKKIYQNKIIQELIAEFKKSFDIYNDFNNLIA